MTPESFNMCLPLTISKTLALLIFFIARDIIYHNLLTYHYTEAQVIQSLNNMNISHVMSVLIECDLL